MGRKIAVIGPAGAQLLPPTTRRADEDKTALEVRRLITALHDERRAAELGEHLVAARLGVQRAVVFRWETGKVTPTLRQLSVWAAVLDCSLALRPDPQTHDDIAAALSAVARLERADPAEIRSRLVRFLAMSKTLAQEQRIFQEKIAERMDMRPATISEWWNGWHFPRLGHLIGLGAAIHMRLAFDDGVTVLLPESGSEPVADLLKALRVRREKLRASREAVAAEIGVSVWSLSQFERAQVTPAALTLFTWAAVLGLGVRWMPENPIM